MTILTKKSTHDQFLKKETQFASKENKSPNLKKCKLKDQHFL